MKKSKSKQVAITFRIGPLPHAAVTRYIKWMRETQNIAMSRNAAMNKLIVLGWPAAIEEADAAIMRDDPGNEAEKEYYLRGNR